MKAKHDGLDVDVALIYADNGKPWAALIYADGSTGTADFEALTFMREQVTYEGGLMPYMTGELVGFFQSGDGDSTEPTVLIKTEDGQLHERSAYKCKVKVVPYDL